MSRHIDRCNWLPITKPSDWETPMSRTYGSTNRIGPTDVKNFILAYVRNGGHPAVVINALTDAMTDEIARLGLDSGGAWAEARTWLQQAAETLRNVERT